jgi:predicted Zn-dependent protease
MNQTNGAPQISTPSAVQSRPTKRTSGKLVLAIVGVASIVTAAWVYKTANDVANKRRADVIRANSELKPATTPAAPASPDAIKSAAKVEEVIAAAAVYSQKGEFAKAEAILKEAVAQYPGDQSVRLKFGELLLGQRRLEEAYAQYEAALSIGPRDAKTEFTAGTVASALGKPERAVEHYSAAQTSDPVNAEYPLYLGQVQAKLGKLDEAKISLLRCAKLDPNRAIAWGTLADIALRENKPEITLQYIAKARELEPGVGVWRIVEARALNRSSQPQKALDVLTGLDESEKRTAPVARLIAETYGLLGDASKSAEWSKRAEEAK